MKAKKLYTLIKSYAVISMLVLIVTSVSVNAMGQKHEYHNDKHQQVQGSDQQQLKMKKRFHRLAKKLALSEKQRDEIKPLFAHMQAERQAQKGALSGFKAQMQTLVQASEFDESEFDAIYAEFQPNFQGIAMAKAKMHHAVMQVLTPEQQQKYLKMRMKR